DDHQSHQENANGDAERAVQAAYIEIHGESLLFRNLSSTALACTPRAELSARAARIRDPDVAAPRRARAVCASHASWPHAHPSCPAPSRTNAGSVGMARAMLVTRAFALPADVDVQHVTAELNRGRTRTRAAEGARRPGEEDSGWRESRRGQASRPCVTP